MKNLYRIVALILLYTHLASAQSFNMPGLRCAEGKHQISSESLAKRNLRYPGDATVDVSYYFLNLAIRPDTKLLKGQVQIDLHALKSGMTSFFLDLNNSFKVDSVVLNAKKVAFSHSSNKLTVILNTPAVSGELLSTKVYYGGIPVQNSNSYSIEFTFHNGQPVIWTLSEPYDAPTWFPCVDNQADKADSCDVWITLPSYYTAVSQGVLQEVTNNSDGTNTAKWKHRYPIAHYLISIAASNYTKQERYYKHSETDSMLVVDYLYPETAANPSLAPLLDRTVDMLELFSDKYGEYPFIKEKYGHAMFGFGGGMEHQTVSSMGGFTFDLIAHELAHQWFGDKVTCKTWRDIWINEGFAEFSALYAGEVLLGKARYKTDIANYMKEAKLVSGTVAIANTNSVNAIFDYRKTYVKGSLILHMLRGVLGDELFFKVLKEFQTTEFAYDAASIEDFQGVAERVRGQSLTWFFDEWLFGEGYPKYSFGWKESASGKLLVQIANAGSSEKTPFFKMPVLLRVKYSSGNTEDIVVFADSPQVLLTLDLKESGVADVTFDPENQILKDLKLTEAPDEILGMAGTDLAIFPNPVSHFLNVSLRSKPEVYNSSGKSFPVDWTEEGIDVKYLPAGRYFIRNNQLVSSFIKL